MATENKLKHLEFIQSVVNRMAGNSFLLRGWSVTLVAALFALAAKDANPRFVVIAYFPVLVFWVLDGYFLSQERLFRALYDKVRALPPNEIDFSMDTSEFCRGKNTWPAAIMSRALIVLYLPLCFIIVLVRTLLK